MATRVDKFNRASDQIERDIYTVSGKGKRGRIGLTPKYSKRLVEFNKDTLKKLREIRARKERVLDRLKGPERTREVRKLRDIREKYIDTRNVEKEALVGLGRRASKRRRFLRTAGASFRRPTESQSRQFRSGVQGLVRAFGVPIKGGYRPLRGSGQRGRPVGSGKYQRAYGVGVIEYRKLISQKRAVIAAQQEQIKMQLAQKGYSPDEIERIRVTKLQQAPEESYEEFVAKNTVSPNTMAILERLKRVQNKARTDDLNMQRILREKRMVNEASDLLKTPSLFKASDRDMNIFDEDYNILKAPNLFQANPDEARILNTKRLGVLNTREAGNDLRFL